MAYDVEYLGGHPLWSKPLKAELVVDNVKKIVVLKTNSFWNDIKPLEISSDEIVDITFEKMGKRSAGKTVAGALIGGVLTGGIGLLVGGAIGANKKNLSEMYINITYKGREFSIALKTGKKTEKIYSEINSLFA